MVTDQQLERLARDVVRAGSVVALSGAGMSVESGIASFRGPGGLWERYDPEEYGHITTLRHAPEKAWQMLREMEHEILKAEPNKGHRAFVELERLGRLDCIITQNVDGLHHVAGNSNVVEFHGNLLTIVCMDCGRSRPAAEVDYDSAVPRCPHCGGPVKPDAVFFGEMIPPDALTRAEQASRGCDLMLVVGTSAMVYPAASMPGIAADHGATVVEINPCATPLTNRVSDYILLGAAGEVLSRLVARVTALV